MPSIPSLASGDAPTAQDWRIGGAAGKRYDIADYVRRYFRLLPIHPHTSVHVRRVVVKHDRPAHRHHGSALDVQRTWFARTGAGVSEVYHCRAAMSEEVSETLRIRLVAVLRTTVMCNHLRCYRRGLRTKM